MTLPRLVAEAWQHPLVGVLSLRNLSPQEIGRELLEHVPTPSECVEIGLSEMHGRDRAEVYRILALYVPPKERE